MSVGTEYPHHADPTELSEIEIARRRDAALLRALSMPHKRQAEMKVGKPKRKNRKSGLPGAESDG